MCLQNLKAAFGCSVARYGIFAGQLCEELVVARELEQILASLLHADRPTDVTFQDKRYGFISELRVKNQTLFLLKPSTYMNLSGNAVRYWMNEKKIELERLLVVVDDLALPFGSLRMKPGGSEAGHNGLRHITQVLGTQQYARLRFGIGNDFPRGGQVDYVLGNLSPEDEAALPERLDVAAEMIKSFALSGIQFTMNHFNKR